MTGQPRKAENVYELAAHGVEGNGLQCWEDLTGTPSPRRWGYDAHPSPGPVRGSGLELFPMAHAIDRTLLASLGFADKDRSLSRHTLACEWAATKAGATKIIGSVGIRWPHGAVSWRSSGGRTEVHISKGDGQYRSTIGFVDVVIGWHTEHYASRRYCGRDECGHYEYEECQCVRESVWLAGNPVGVEVKITPVDVASIIRQIALYRSYTNEWTWVLLVDWDLTDMDVTALRREKIVPLRLGESFAEFCELQGGIAKIASL